MPELPEVETVRRGLESVICGARIADVVTHRKGLRLPFPKDLQTRLSGRRVTSLGRRAKYLLIHIDGPQTLVIHLGMSGRIRTACEHIPEKHDHFMLTFNDGNRLILNDARRFGFVLLMNEHELSSHAAFRHLGPEPLSNDFSGPVLAQRLKGKKTSIKAALLDQRVVAGVGNIYACEALFESGINPKKLAGTIKGQKAEDLAAAIRATLERAVAAGGSTLRDYRQVSGETGYFQHDFKVYDREGKKCAGCTCDIIKTGGIKRMAQGGRSTFYCPRRQA